MRKLRIFLKLSSADKCKVIALSVLTFAAQFKLTFFGNSVIAQYFERSRSYPGRPGSKNQNSITTWLHLLDLVDRNIPRPSCLRRSLALIWLSRFLGSSLELNIGVRRNGTELEAHAWAEQDGVSLEIKSSETFLPLNQIHPS